MSGTRANRWLYVVGILGLCLVIGAISIAAQPKAASRTVAQTTPTVAASPQSTSATNDPNAARLAAVQKYLAITGDNFPKVVAYVDGNAITGKELAQTIFTLQQGPIQVSGQALTDAALQSLIQQRILIDHASDYGINVTTADATSFAQQQKSIAAQDPNAAQLVALNAAALGLSPSSYFESPQVIEIYRQELTLSEMQQYIFSKVPAEQQSSSVNWRQAALTKFVSGINAKVTILIAQ